MNQGRESRDVRDVVVFLVLLVAAFASVRSWWINERAFHGYHEFGMTWTDRDGVEQHRKLVVSRDLDELKIEVARKKFILATILEIKTETK